MLTSPPAIGLLFGLGLFLVVVALAVKPDLPDPDGELVRRRRPSFTAVSLLPIVLGVVVALLTWGVFQIPVLSIAGFAAVVLPGEVRRRSQSSIVTAKDVGETANTVARWIESVRDYLQTSGTLQDAMVRAALEVRGPHAHDFERFASTLNGAGGFPRAAEELAAELENPLADKALTALWIGGREGGNLNQALSLLAESAQVEADNARRIEAERAGTRRLVRIIAILCVVIFVLALIGFRENFEVYRSVGGQIILGLGLAGIAFSLMNIWKMSRLEAQERLISVVATGEGVRTW